MRSNFWYKHFSYRYPDELEQELHNLYVDLKKFKKKGKDVSDIEKRIEFLNKVKGLKGRRKSSE